MSEWQPTRWTAPFTEADEKAFADPLIVNSHFGLPLPMAERAFSISLNEAGLTNVHNGGFRPHYFGNTVAMQYIKQRYPDSWIWDERYRFAATATRIQNRQFKRAQDHFIRIMGDSRIREVVARGKAIGLDPGGREIGRPDVAIYCPNEKIQWRFMEIKISSRGDKLRPIQEQWLRLLSDIFGEGASIELELVKEQ